MQSKDLKIGVCITTYNRQELLLRAITSLQDQTYGNWEVYIVDDCSSDDVYKYLDNNNIFIDERIHYERFETNQGANRARNRALDLIMNNQSIEYISLLDDDDYFLPNYFQTAVDIITKKQIDWLVTSCIYEDKGKVTQIKQEGYMHYLDYRTGTLMAGDSTMMLSRSLLGETRYMTETRNYYEWSFFYYLSTKSDMYVQDIPSKVVKYLDNGLTMSKKPKFAKVKFEKKVLRECGYNYYMYCSKKHKYLYETKGKISHKIRSISYYAFSLIAR